MSPLALLLLAAVPLVALLLLGRASLQWQLRLVASGAIVALVACVVLGRLASSEGTLAVASDLAFAACGYLTVAAWALLQYTALRADLTGWSLAGAGAVVLTALPLLVPTMPLALYYALMAGGLAATLALAWALPLEPAISPADATRSAS
jgi:hypothetical protein